MKNNWEKDMKEKFDQYGVNWPWWNIVGTLISEERQRIVDLIEGMKKSRTKHASEMKTESYAYNQALSDLKAKLNTENA